MTGKVLTRPGETRTTFDSGDEYIERIEAAVAIFRSKNLDPQRPVPDQMNETTELGTGRVRNPMYHYVISWQKKSVTHKEAHKAVAKTVEALGARGWQWVGALHGDTENPHCHVIINRIHPETGLAWRTSYDRYKLAKICQSIEPARDKQTIVDLPAPRAADYEVYTGQMSLQSWGRQVVMPAFAERVLSSRNRSWDVAHAILAMQGLTYDATGILRDSTGKQSTQTKASGVSSMLALPYLEKRLGLYQNPRPDIVISKEGYGSARDRFELTTERMKKPDLAPIYNEWVNERKKWERGGRLRSMTRRQNIKEHGGRAKKAILNDLSQARQILIASVPELADHIGKELKDVADGRIETIATKQRESLKTLARAKPNELFRTWLKTRAKNGDAEAAQAITTLRQGDHMDQQQMKAPGIQNNKILFVGPAVLSRDEPEMVTEEEKRRFEEDIKQNEEIGIEGSIKGTDDSGKIFTSEVNSIEQDLKNQYKEYLSTFASVGMGAQQQVHQHYLNADRYQAINEFKESAIQLEDKKDWVSIAHAEVIAAKERANIARRIRMETEILIGATHAVPPLSFRDYLLSLEDERAKHIASKIDKDEEVQSVFYQKHRGHEAAKDVNVRLTKNSITYYMDGKARFYDSGSEIHIESTKSQKVVDAALLISQERYGASLLLEGSDTYKDRVLQRAVLLNIYISNPELQEEQKRLIAERDNRAKEQREIKRSDLSKEYQRVVLDPNLTPKQRTNKINEFLDASAKDVVEREYNIKVKKPQGDEVGHLTEILILESRAYGILRDFNEEHVLVPLDSGYAQECEANGTQINQSLVELIQRPDGFEMQTISAEKIHERNQFVAESSSSAERATSDEHEEELVNAGGRG